MPARIKPRFATVAHMEGKANGEDDCTVNMRLHEYTPPKGRVLRRRFWLRVISLHDGSFEYWLDGAKKEQRLTRQQAESFISVEWHHYTEGLKVSGASK